MQDNPRGRLAARVASVCFWVALWAVLAAFVGNDILLAGPVATLDALGSLLASQQFWASVALSGGRIIGSACASALAGILLGFCAGRWRLLETLLEIPIQVMKSAPVACVVVVLLVAFGSVGAIVVIVAFVALPPFYIASLEAFRTQEDDAARVLGLMGLSGAGIFFACTWPRILPLYRHAAKTAVALSWRAGITGELLSIPLGSMGAGIYVAKLTLDTPALLAWTGIVMILAFACEFIVLRLLDLTASSPKLALLTHRRTPTPGGVSSDASKDGVVLGVEAVSKGYDGVIVLDGISLALAVGTRVCLMAPTGTGKTTLLRIMLGMERAEGGEVTRPTLCGTVLQQTTLVECLSAWENVALVADATRSADDMRERLEKILPEGALDREAASLSGGTKRLTEIGRAIFSPGSCIVLDEPFAGLDEKSRVAACSFIMCNLDERPLVVATHERGDVGLLEARVVEL